MENLRNFEWHARRRRGIDWLKEQLYRCIHSDTPAKETIVVEELPRNDSEMPQEDLKELFNVLAIWENDERQNMARFPRTFNGGLPAALTNHPGTNQSDEQSEATPTPPPKRKARKPQSP
jgi:hypothetical protein